MQSIVSGSFDNLRSRDMRFLEEAARLGDLHILLWSDQLVREQEGQEPRFPEAEREYLLRAIRYVSRVTLVNIPPSADNLAQLAGERSCTWVVRESHNQPAAGCHVIPESRLDGFPEWKPRASLESGRKKALVTGCYDWLHSGHVRFFEEVSQLGDLYVVVGHDANVRHLKGEGHPLFPQEERRYMVQSIRYVTEALISTGWGWMDAAPEIERLKPDYYVVNEDGDKPEKGAFSAEHGLEYVVLKRLPKEGLPRRESTHLRGF